MVKAKIKGVKSGPLLAMLAQDEIELDQISLNKMGKILVEAVKEEAKKDFARRGQSGLHDPQGLPDSRGRHIKPTFYNSFRFRVVGKKTVEILSTWPWIEGLIEGRSPWLMDKHTQANPNLRGKRIPFYKDGKVIFRMVPSIGAKMWVHPAIAKHTFLRRGVEKGRNRLLDGALLRIIEDQAKRMMK